MRVLIKSIVSRRLAALGGELNRPEMARVTDETHLMGERSPLDSIGLVTLIADLEGDIQREFGKAIVLADEKAISRTLSPFRKVGTLVDYIESKLAGAN